MNEIFLKFKTDFDKFLTRRVVDAADSVHVENIRVIDFQIHFHALNFLAGMILRSDIINAPYWFYYDTNKRRAGVNLKCLYQNIGKYCASVNGVPCSQKKIYANVKNTLEIFCDKFTI